MQTQRHQALEENYVIQSELILFKYASESLAVNISRRNNFLFSPPQINQYKKQIEAHKLVFKLSTKEKKIFSQNGEDGIIEAIFDHIGTRSKYYVEFGTESGTECNTRLLRDKKNWSGLLMDGEHENEAYNLHKEMIFPHNIVSLFRKYNVPKKFDLLSVDTDFKDWYILRNILKAGYRPRVIIAEVNSCLSAKKAITIPILTGRQTHWDNTTYFGFSIRAGWMLARHFGYSMVYCDLKFVNCFYVIDGEDGLGAGFRLSDYVPAEALWKRTPFIRDHGNKNRSWSTITKEMMEA